MREVKFRCSSIGKLMTEPKLKSEVLSVGAKTYIRQLAAEEIFGVEFEVSSKHMEKGIIVEPDSLALLNRVRGLSLVKNTERRTDDFITGECDLFDTHTGEGRDLKSAWSIATFPISEDDCEGSNKKLYEWQMRGYMRLWNAERWHVDYCLVNTPDNLIGYEPASLHFVDHIPEQMRVTTWTVKRDRLLEVAMVEKVQHARRYYAEVIAEFDRSHGRGDALLEDQLRESIAKADPIEPPPWETTAKPLHRAAAALPANPFEAHHA